MRRTIFVIVLLLFITVFSATFGLAAKQNVTIIVPARALIWILTPSVTMDIPSIDTWPAGNDTYTKNSSDFHIITALNTLGNSDMVVTSTPLQNANGQTIPLSGLRVTLNTLFTGANTSASLDQTVILKNIGFGPQLTTGSYALTVNDSQQAGRYIGTVTYTLVNK